MLFSLVDSIRLRDRKHWLGFFLRLSCDIQSGVLRSIKTVSPNAGSFLEVGNHLERTQKAEKVAFETGINKSG